MSATRTETPRASLLALVGWAAFVSALVWIVLIGGGQLGVKAAALRSINLYIIVIGLVVWALLAWRRDEWRPRSVIWPALLLPFVAMLISTLASSHPRLALDYLAWDVLLVSLYLLLIRILARPFAQRRLGGVLVVLAVLVSGAYIGVVVTHWLEWWDLVGRLTAPMLRPGYAGLLLGGPTTVAPVFVLLAVSAFAAVGVSSARARLALVVVGLVTLGAVFLSGSRAAWLGLAVALVVVGGGLLIAHRHQLAGLVRDRRVRIGAIVAVLLAGAAALVMAPSLLARLNTSGDGGRAYYATVAQRMFEDAPVLGQGPGNWAARRIEFTAPGEMNHYIDHAHNIYLQTLAELGLVGLLLGAVALVSVLWLVVSALRSTDPARRRWALAAGFVIIYLGVSFLFDSYVNLPVIIILAAVPFAALDATAEDGLLGRFAHTEDRSAGRTEAVVTVAVFATAFVAAVVLFRVESLATEHQRAVDAADEGDWATAAIAAENAARGDPEMTPYQLTLGLTAAAGGDWGAASEAFGAVADEDDVPEAWLNLALARLAGGEPEAAVLEAIERAARVDPDAPSVLLTSAYLYDRLGMRDASDEAYTELLATEPSVAADPLWRSDPEIAPRAEALYAAAMERAADPWQLALMWGDHERARVLAAESTKTFDEVATEAWLGDEEGLAKLHDRALASPHDRTLTSWAARASAATGDVEGAEHFRRIIDFDDVSFGDPALEMRVQPAGEAKPAGATDPVIVYGLATHHRELPDRIVAQGLPGLLEVDLAEAAALPSTTP